jgi:GrpB-like predicted nucleotidyltransferase (UPF0157 family)
MYRIVEAVRQSDLASLLDDIRSWLEHNGCSSVPLMTRKETVDIITIQIDFNYLDLAEAFIKAFQGWGLFPTLVSALR